MVVGCDSGLSRCGSVAVYLSDSVVGSDDGGFSWGRHAVQRPITTRSFIPFLSMSQIIPHSPAQPRAELDML